MINTRLLELAGLEQPSVETPPAAPTTQQTTDVKPTEPVVDKVLAICCPKECTAETKPEDCVKEVAVAELAALIKEYPGMCLYTVDMKEQAIQCAKECLECSVKPEEKKEEKPVENTQPTVTATSTPPTQELTTTQPIPVQVMKKESVEFAHNGSLDSAFNAKVEKADKDFVPQHIKQFKAMNQEVQKKKLTNLVNDLNDACKSLEVQAQHSIKSKQFDDVNTAVEKCQVLTHIKELLDDGTADSIVKAGIFYMNQSNIMQGAVPLSVCKFLHNNGHEVSSVKDLFKPVNKG